MQRPAQDDSHPSSRSDQPPNRSTRRGAKDHTPRPIRPAARTSQSPVPLDSLERTLTKRQRVGTRKACDHCRLKKIRCDGESPRCTPCLVRDVECYYRADRPREDQIFAGLIQRLRTLPENEAIELLRRLRSTNDLESVLSSAAGNASNQYRPSDIETARAHSPPTNSRIEFELSVKYRIVYPPHTFRHPIHDMHTLLQQPALPLSHLDGPPIHEADELGFRDLPASGPNLAQKYYEERLNRLELSNWTSVAIADDFAASVLSNYLELNHPVLGLFDAGLFLRDLTNLQHDFCSTFLVNATLAFACQSFTGIDLRAAPLASAFIREAERLWRSEGLLDSALNVASILMLSVSIHTYGGDLKVTDLLDGGRCMAQRLGMFGPQLRSPSGVGSGEMSAEHQRSMAHIAHGAYAWLSLCTFYYPQNPTHLPPLWPATGPDSFGNSASEPLGIPARATELAAIVDSKFTALCQFWSIMQVVATTYFASRPKSKSVREPIPLHFAESTYRKLLAWANTLEGTMSRENGGPEHVLVFHILFHCAVIRIFIPFVNDSKENRLLSFSSTDSSVKTVLHASISQLKGLLLDCRQDRRKMLLIAHTNAAILHVSNAMLLDAADRAGRGSPQDPDCRPYFLLCLANCRDMYTCFPVFGSVGRGLLAMAMRDGVMDSESAKRLVATLDSRGTHHDPTARRALGTFTIDFALAMREPEHAEAATLARQFDELTLFADLTTGTW